MKNKAILRIIADIKRTNDLFLWKIQNRFINIDISDCSSLFNVFLKALVISPHADDELIGCHEVLSDPNINSSMLYIGLLGYQNGNDLVCKTRLDEYVKYSKVVQKNIRLCTKMWQDDLCDEILNGYDAIFIPSIIDWHWEHREVSYQAIKYVYENELPVKLFFYQVTVPLPQISHYNYTNDEKWSVFNKVYVSQNFMPIDRFKSFSGCYVVNGNKDKIEPYYQLTRDQMKLIINAYKVDRFDKLNEAKKYINDFVQIRKCAVEYWNHIV